MAMRPAVDPSHFLLESLESRVLLTASGFGNAFHWFPPQFSAPPPPSSIAADWAEPNNTISKASDLGAIDGAKTWPSLSIQSRSDTDWFKFTLPAAAAGAGDYAKITFSDALGDLDMALYNSRGRMVDYSDGVTDQEQIPLDGCGAGTYYLEVYGYRGATNPAYTLAIGVPSTTIAADHFEPNDTRETATPLGAIETHDSRWDNLTLPQGDEDWFTFTTTLTGKAGDAVRVEAAQSPTSPDVALYDSDGNLLRSSAPGTGSASVSLAGLLAGTYYACLSGAASAQYSLVVDAPTTAVAPQREWTILAYVDGDNNLERYAIADLNEMEAAVLPPSVTVAVEVDRTPGYDSSNGNWTDTRHGVITHDTSLSTLSSPLVSIGEKDMGNPATLQDFITWGVSSYPAAHYALVLWDHGGGLSGVCWDDSSGGDNLTIPELTSAIAGAGTHLDVVGFDACLTGLFEQLYQLRSVTDVVVASEQTVPVAGWNYTDVLKKLAANPTMGGEAFGTAIVSSYAAQYGNAETLTATRTSAYDALASALTSFSDTVTTGATAADWTAITTARRSTAYFTDTDYRDLKGLMSRLATSSISSSIKTAAQAVITAIDNAVIANHSGTREGGTGISINLPAATASLAGYTATEFDLVADTHWRSFLQALVSPASRSATTGTATGRMAAARPGLLALGDLLAGVAPIRFHGPRGV
jgi:hypothetical protein